MSKRKVNPIARAAQRQSQPDRNSLPAAATTPAVATQVQINRQTIESYQGAVPHPALIEHFNRLVPEAGRTLFRWAEEEIAHRHAMDGQAMQANIATQAKQIAIAEFEAKETIRTDRIGLYAGITICFVCIGAAVFLALNGLVPVALGIIALPTAGILMALRGKAKPAPDKSDPPKKS